MLINLAHVVDFVVRIIACPSQESNLIKMLVASNIPKPCTVCQMEPTKKPNIVDIGKALVAATTKAQTDRDPAPLAAALSEALAANLPRKCAAAVRARKLLDSLEKEKAVAEEEAQNKTPKVAKVRQKRAPRQARTKLSKVGAVSIHIHRILCLATRAIRSLNSCQKSV